MTVGNTGHKNAIAIQGAENRARPDNHQRFGIANTAIAPFGWEAPVLIGSDEPYEHKSA